MILFYCIQHIISWFDCIKKNVWELGWEHAMVLAEPLRKLLHWQRHRKISAGLILFRKTHGN